jgi:N-acetylmuramoyl-L-alanine amidase
MVRIAAFALIGLMSFRQKYSGDDLWYLSRVIQSEAGYCTQEMQEAVGSVVLNRVASDKFPNTIAEVIQQPGQYSTLGWLESNPPTSGALEVAIDLLENGSKLPGDVLYQANFPQGTGTYETISTCYSTMYFCTG